MQIWKLFKNPGFAILSGFMLFFTTVHYGWNAIINFGGLPKMLPLLELLLSDIETEKKQ